MQIQPSERKLHPISFAFELASQVRQLIVPGLFLLIAGARGSDSWQIYAMLLVVPYALVSIARALVFRYSFEPDELAIRSGLLFKQQRHIPYRRIQNIDAIQSVFHRVLGVVEVRMETAGGEEPEAHLKVVSLAAFEEVRTRVAAARGHLAAPREVREATNAEALEPGEVATGEAGSGAGTLAGPQREPGVILLKLSARELVTCGLIQGRGLLVLGALFGLFWEAGLVDRMTGPLFDDAIQGRGVVRRAVGALFGHGIPPAGGLLTTLAAFASLLVLTRAFSVGWALVRLHEFTLRKAGDDLRVDFGLFTRVAATIPIRRIQSISVHEGPLHRCFQRVSVHVNTAGGERDEAVQLQRQWLAPVVPRAQVTDLLRSILPPVAPPHVDWQPVHPRGVRRARAEWLLVAAIISAVLIVALRWWTPALFVLLALVGELHVRRSVHALGWGLTDAAVFFRSGWLWRRQTVAPISKVQVVRVGESPFDRRMEMASVAVDTAGTSARERRIHVPYLSRPVAEDLAARIAADVARTRFKW